MDVGREGQTSARREVLKMGWSKKGGGTENQAGRCERAGRRGAI